MYLIAGLGNPGREYDMTRHNIGFEVIDYIADRYKIKVKKLKFKSLYQKAELAGEDVILMKPQTYMNLSGESVRDAAAFYKIPPEKIIIISDDINLDAGRIKIKKSGSAGGHNGLKNIIQHMGSEAFTRVRVGVGESGGDMVGHVLGRFSSEDAKTMDEAISKAADAVKCLVTDGPELAMTRFNTKKDEAK